MRTGIFILIIMSFGLAACGQNTVTERSPEEMAQIAERAATLRPSDSALASIYERSCINCHGVPGSGAPLTGDGVAWAPRLAKGNDVLIDHTTQGFNGMPPFGMCPDCSLETFRELIAFMSTDGDQ